MVKHQILKQCLPLNRK